MILTTARAKRRIKPFVYRRGLASAILPPTSGPHSKSSFYLPGVRRHVLTEGPIPVHGKRVALPPPASGLRPIAYQARAGAPAAGTSPLRGRRDSSPRLLPHGRD